LTGRQLSYAVSALNHLVKPRGGAVSTTASHVVWVRAGVRELRGDAEPAPGGPVRRWALAHKARARRRIRVPGHSRRR